MKANGHKPVFGAGPIHVEVVASRGWRFESNVYNQATLDHEWRRLKQAKGRRRLVQVQGENGANQFQPQGRGGNVQTWE